MKKYTILLFTCFLVTAGFSQKKTKAFQSGEWLRYRMSYSGWMRAGSAILEVKETKLNGKKVLHSKGTGWTSGMVKWFFKVDDTYQSYFDISSVKPFLFKRKIDEGGYKKNRQVTFDYNKSEAYVQDFIKKKDTTVTIKNVQDMLSSFYYLRNRDVRNFKKGDEIVIDMFLDTKIYRFKLRFLGRDILKTKFGKIKTLKFRPIVQSGRIFKAEESVTIWVTADDNKIPIKMEASLSVGSLRADLESYKGLANSFKIIFD